MKFIENQLKINEIHWKSMKIIDNQWSSMKTIENAMRLNEIHWTILETTNIHWKCEIAARIRLYRVHKLLIFRGAGGLKIDF